MQFPHTGDGYRRRLTVAAVVGIAAAAAGGSVLLSGCGSGSRTVPVTAYPTPTPSSSPGTGAQVSATVPANGSKTVSVQPAGSSSNFTFNFTGVAGGPVGVTITPLTETQLPAPITRAFVPNAGNKFVFGFKLQANGQGFTFSQFANAVLVGGNIGNLLPPFTVLNLAEFNTQTNSWNDVATISVDANGNLSTQHASALLPGILNSGTYVIYQPAAGTSTSVANFGLAMLADEQNGTGALQIVSLFDTNGNPLATPVLSSIKLASNGDLDGAALTPDASQGIVVDGSNLIDLFSGVQSGHPTANPNPLDVSQYGGDGDSVALLPNGDTAVVALDSNDTLAVVAGITSGNPHVVGTIPVPNNKDGVVISNDGKVLLARSFDSLTVFSIGPATSGSSLPYTFTQTADFPDLKSAFGEDGRDGMAFSPVDSSRAVVLSADPTTYAPTVTLLTGLPSNPVTRSAAARMPAFSGTRASSPASLREPRRSHTRAAVSGASELLSVAVDYSGNLAVVGTDTGLLMFSGVSSGNIQQVGGAYSPSITSGTQSFNLAGVTTLGITLDNKYVVVGSQKPSASQGTLLTIPFSASGFANPVGQLNGVSIPDNDQLLVH